MIIALAFVVGMLVVVVALVVRRSFLDGVEIATLREGDKAQVRANVEFGARIDALKADHEKLVRSLRNQRGIVDGG